MQIHPWRLAVLFATLSLLLLPSKTAFGQELIPLKSILAEALAQNPDVAAAQKRFEAAKQRPSQASSLPDPMFSPGWTSNGRPWPGAGLGSMPTSQVGFMVSQEIPYPGKRKLAGKMAEREADAEFAAYQQLKLGLVAQVKQAYYRWAWAEQTLDVIDRNLALSGKIQRITEARYGVGKAAQQDVFKAQTQISLLETRKVQVERERLARQAELASLLNRRGSSLEGKPEPLEELGELPQYQELIAAAQELSPLLRQQEQMIQRAELAVNMARKEFYPDLTLNGGYYNMGGMPDMYMFRADFKIPLYFFRKQKAAVTEQTQRLIESRKTLESAERSIEFRIKDELLAAQTSAQLAKLYGGTVIPQASLTLESALPAYETGAVDFLTILTNYGALLEYELNYWEEIANVYAALARLEQFTARNLTGEAP